MNKTLTLLAVVLATAATTFAGEAVSKKVVVPAVQENLFNANEWQFDAYMVGVAGKYNHSQANGLGGGLGLSYFFSRYIGIGVDDSLESIKSKATDSFSGNLIGRLPIESIHLAPYAFIGGGSNWGAHKAQGSGDAGVGFEYRFTKNVGVFIDSRWIYGGNSLSESLSRAGVRFAF